MNPTHFERSRDVLRYGLPLLFVFALMFVDASCAILGITICTRLSNIIVLVFAALNAFILIIAAQRGLYARADDLVLFVTSFWFTIHVHLACTYGREFMPLLFSTACSPAAGL